VILLGALAGLRVLRWIFRILIWLVLAVLVYLVVTGVQVWLTSRHYEPRPAGAIVVMGAAQYNGAPSPDLASRLREALVLWRGGDAKLIVVTGGKQPGDRYTEADASATYLVVHGVPDADILEVAGRDTWQELALAAPLLRDRRETMVLVVTDPFHEDRSVAVATDVGLVPYPTPTQTSPISGWSTVPYFAKETVGVALGRIIGFNHLSWLHDAVVASVPRRAGSGGRPPSR
jgi:uncharacterized SAM-binding protein YcdF (DUF218 family)